MPRTRRRVAIERISGDAARQVSFSKRRQGLFKKVCELSTLCGAESAILVHSPAGRVYSLGDPDVHTVVDRFLEYASRPDEESSSGTSTQQGEGSSSNSRSRRRPQHQRQQNQPRGDAPEVGRRKILEEQLYRQLAEQDNWHDEAKVNRAVLTADLKDKEQRLLPHRWGEKVQDLDLRESEDMADALEELAVRVAGWIREKEEEEGIPPEQRWSLDDPAPPPSNPWRQAAFLTALGAHAAAPWGAANMVPMPGAGVNVPFAPMNPPIPGAMGAPAGPPMVPGMLPLAEGHPAPAGFMAPAMAPAAAGIGVPMGAMMGVNPYAYAASSSSSVHPMNAQLFQAALDGEGTSTGLGPQFLFY